jgi:serine protease
LGLLRSINPLLPVGNPFAPVGSAYGVRNLVAATASRDGVWEQYLGYGIPNAEAAVLGLLGSSRGYPVGNRVTPLFSLYSPAHNDYAAVATPQLAVALSLYQWNRYYSHVVPGVASFIEGTPVPGYASFPKPAAGAPRAAALVLTTSQSPHVSPLVPLFLLDRCSDMNCQSGHDFLLLSEPARVQAAVAAGYRYAGRQGYVYQRCEPAVSCAPPGTEPLHLKCRATSGGCAVFLERNRAAFESAGYTSLLGGSATSVLGNAYPVLDSDNDGLPDAMERLLGTSLLHADSDGDGISDGGEYPFDGVPVSDPCAPLQGHCTRPVSQIFRDGFQ